MARRKAKYYSRFDVASYVKEKKRLRNETALGTYDTYEEKS